MTKSKSTKRALIASVFALVVCFAMLVGSTFAWFTDSASTSVNTIRSGNLKVGLVDKDGNNIVGNTLDFVKAEGAPADEAILWEPGCTYKLPEIFVKNNGNLALKYKLMLNGVDGDAKLLEAIEWTVTVGDAVTDLSTYEGHLVAGATADQAVVISGHMKETAGNEYQDLSIEGVSIMVVATQDTVEYDSTTNEYDKDAAYPVVDAASAKSALAEGGVVVFASDVTAENANTYAGRNVVNSDTVVNMADSTLTFRNAATDDNLVNISALYQMSGGTTLTLNADNGGIDSDFYGVVVGATANAEGDNLVINGGTYKAGSVVQVQNGTVTINGGFFDGRDIYGHGDATFLLNCLDTPYKNGTAKIVVTGGTFVNFDPANNRAEGAGTNFVADGYTVTSETDGTDTFYTVVKA